MHTLKLESPYTIAHTIQVQRRKVKQQLSNKEQTSSQDPCLLGSKETTGPRTDGSINQDDDDDDDDDESH